MKSLDLPNYRLTGEIDDPTNLDYDIFGLHKKRTLVKGELLTVEYYKNYDGVTYSELVVKEDREYIRNINGIATQRNMNISWYLEDGSIGTTKSTIKYYSPQEGIDEGITRRRNVIADAKLYVLSQVGLVNGKDFMTSLASEIMLYENGETQALRDSVQASSKQYLTQQIKDTVVFILTL